MHNTNDSQSANSGLTPEKAQRILQLILDSGSPQDHREALHEMMVSWLRANREVIDAHHERVYLTYVALKAVLTNMEGMKDE